MTTTELPSFRSYGDYSSNNYGVNALVFNSPAGTFYFSYKTLVAFYHPERGRVVHENYWGPTTGKHLNWIDDGDKKGRVGRDEFERLYAEAYPDAGEAA